MAPLAVHIGPGRLGLGLIVDVLRKTGSFDVCLVARPDGPPERLIYRLAFADPSIGLVTRDVQWACRAETLAEVDMAVRDRIGSGEPLLITVALGGKVAEREALIREILEARPRDAPTLLLACENEPDPVYQRIAKDHPTVGYCASVVDRICNKDCPERDDFGARVFLVHPVGEWVISQQDPRFDSLMSLLTEADEVRVVDETEIPAYKHRKLWIVNGVHLLLALLARRRGQDELPLTSTRAAAFRAAVEPMIVTTLSAVERKWGLAASPAYAEARVKAFCEAPDSAGRVLRDRLVRSNLRPLMERLNTRIGAAARAASEVGLDCAPFLTAAELVLETLKDRSVFIAGDAAPSAKIDEEAVQEFASFLAGWAAVEHQESMVRRLRDILAGQRDD